MSARSSRLVIPRIKYLDYLTVELSPTWVRTPPPALFRRIQENPERFRGS